MGRTLQIPIPRVFLPLLQPARYKGLYGGRGSAKSHGFADLMLDAHLEPGQRSVCVREFQLSLKQSVKRLLEDKIKLYNLSSQFRVMETEIRTPGDGLITFQGMQNHTADSIKSLEGYDRAWVEEAQSLSRRSLQLLRPTIRKERCRYCRQEATPDVKSSRCESLSGVHLFDPSELWFSWNPRFPTDPVDELLRRDIPPNAIVIGATYRDNPWFPDVLRAEMEWDRNVDIEKYTHVWLGGYEKHSEARVFKNWRVDTFEAPDDATFYFGADWGFAIDPATLVRVRVEEHDPVSGVAWPRKRLYIDYELYQVGIEIDHLPAFYDGLVCGCRDMTTALPENPPLIAPPTCRNPPQHGIARAWPIVADSARPETISYMRRHGYPRMQSAKKGPNSIKEGVIFLQGYDIVVHARCVATQDEFTTHSYKRDPLTDAITPIIEDKKNHIIDPTRYAVEQLRKPTTWVTW